MFCMRAPIKSMAVTAAISLSDLLQEVGISEQQLDNRVSDDQLLKVSLFLVSRERLAPSLELDASDIEVIEKDGKGEEDKRLKMLQRWKDKNAFKATFRKLVEAFLSLGMAEHAEKVCRLLSPEATSSVEAAVSEAVEVAEKNRLQIRGRFLRLQMLVCEKLQAMQINMRKFLYFIKGLFQCTDFIPDTEEFDEIFQAITQHRLWDFINYFPLHEIAKEFGGNDKEINQGFKEYLREYASYRAVTTLAEYIACTDRFPEKAYGELGEVRGDPHYFTRLSMKLKAKVTEKSLDYVIELWDSLLEYLCLPSLTYLLDTIQEGCVSVTWLIPPIAMSAIVRKIDDPETAKFFSKLGIIRMETDDLCLYDAEQELVVDTTNEQRREQQFSDSQEQVQKETSQDIAKETAELNLQELPQHDKEGDRVSELQEIIRKTQEKNDELSESIAYKEVELGQLKERVTGSECMLSQVQEKNQQLRYQLEQNDESIAYKEVELGQLKERVTGLECMLSQVQEENQQLINQLEQTTEQLLRGETHGLETSRIDRDKEGVGGPPLAATALGPQSPPSHSTPPSRGSERNPTEVTDEYEIYAYAPPSLVPPQVRYGKWLVFRKIEQLDKTWHMIRRAVESGKLGCSEASCSTMRYNPRKTGGRSQDNSVIRVFTSEEKMDEVGINLCRLVRHDVSYKTEEASKKGEYKHRKHDKNERVTSKTVFWNDGVPDLECTCGHITLWSDVCQPDPLSGAGPRSKSWAQSQARPPGYVERGPFYGRWEIVVDCNDVSEVWHKIKHDIETGQLLGFKKAECTGERPVILVYTSEEVVDSVRMQLLSYVGTNAKMNYVINPGRKMAYGKRRTQKGQYKEGAMKSKTRMDEEQLEEEVMRHSGRLRRQEESAWQEWMPRGGQGQRKRSKEKERRRE